MLVDQITSRIQTETRDFVFGGEPSRYVLFQETYCQREILTFSDMLPFYGCEILINSYAKDEQVYISLWDEDQQKINDRDLGRNFGVMQFSN